MADNVNGGVVPHGTDDAARPPEAWPKVAIIVLNWNGWRDAIACLESLQDITYPNYQIIVVDNGSTDDSVDRLQAWASGEQPVESAQTPGRSPRQTRMVIYSQREAELGGDAGDERALQQVAPSRRVVMILNRANLGFAAGNNVAIRYAIARRFPYVNLINNDVSVQPTYLTTLVQSLGSGARWSGVGPKVLYATREGRIWYAGGRVKLWRAGGDHVGLRQPDSPSWSGVYDTGFVPGCCFLVKSCVFASVGFLDEDFFFGLEDVDYALRARRRGFQFAVNLDATVYHNARVRWDGEHPKLAYYHNKYRLLLLKKHGTPLQQLLGFCVVALTRVPKFAWLLVQRQRALVLYELRSIRDFLLGRYGDYDRHQAVHPRPAPVAENSGQPGRQA